MSRVDKKIPLIVILGPTASGKTGLSLKLAKEFKGEIISADSRQIYKYMDIGTAKEPGKWGQHDKEKVYMIQGIPHYLIDFLDPRKEYSAALFKKEAAARIKEIYSRGKIPFLTDASRNLLPVGASIVPWSLMVVKHILLLMITLGYRDAKSSTMTLSYSPGVGVWT